MEELGDIGGSSQERRVVIPGKRHRLAMIGGGAGSFIGAVHRDAIRLSDRFQLVSGCFSRSPDANAQTANEAGIDETRLYADYQKLLENESERIDGVVIVTPNNTHFPIADAALTAGINVFSEKPATLSLADAKRLRLSATKTGAHYALAHTYHGYPLVGEMRTRILAGDIGKVRRIDVAYRQGWLSQPIERDGNKQAEWRTDPMRAGMAGALGDIGTHAFALAEFVTGQRIESIVAQVNTFVPKRQLDDDASALLRTREGAAGTLVASQICAGEENALEVCVHGELGALKWRQENPHSLELRRGDGDISIIRGGANAPQVCPSTLAGYRLPMGHPEGYLHAFANLYNAFADMLEGKQVTPPGLNEAVRGMAFIEAMLKSQSTGVAVSLDDLIEGTGE